MLKEPNKRTVVKYGAENAIIVSKETGFTHKEHIQIEQPNNDTLIIKRLKAV